MSVSVSNTLSVRNLPSELLNNHGKELRELSAMFGEVAHFVLFKTHSSASLVFSHTEGAATTKTALEARYPGVHVAFAKVSCFSLSPFFFFSFISSLPFFWQPVSVHEEARAYLQVPINDKAFLISPPASPPLDWEPTLEKSPVGHDEDFVQDLYGRLENVQLQQVFQGEDILPSIVVEDCDFHKGGPSAIDDLLEGPISKTDFRRTKRPPIAQHQ